jgi:hypothetical protein
MTRYSAELAPVPRLVMDEAPPVGVKLYLISDAGVGFLGQFHPEMRIIAWCPLPKLTENQKDRLRAVGEGE